MPGQSIDPVYPLSTRCRDPGSMLYYHYIFEEENTMTVRELALNWIEHADETPVEIDLARAEELIGWMDPCEDLPEDLTPESFMVAWNDILAESPPEDLWS